MYISERDFERLAGILSAISTEGLKPKQTRNRITNLADKGTLIMKRTRRKQQNTLNLE